MTFKYPLLRAEFYAVVWMRTVAIFMVTLCSISVTTAVVQRHLPCDCIDTAAVCSERDLTSLDGEDLCDGNITSLNIRDNYLVSFPHNLSDTIVEVFISHNLLTCLPYPPKLNPHMRVLDLSFNNISDITDQLKNLSKLEELDISENMISSVKWLPDPCALRNLDVSNNKISHIQEINKCSLLEELELSGNNICLLTSDTFHGLSNLQHLGLATAGIEQVPSNIFDKMTHLRELDLTGNNIKVLGSRVLSSLQELRSLRLGGNNFSEFPFAIGENALLEKLDLSASSLKALPSKAFARNTHLKELRLNFLELEHVSSDAFSGLSELENLYFFRSNLSSLPDGLFSNLTNIHRLIMISCNLSQTSPDIKNHRHLRAAETEFNSFSSNRHLDLDGIIAGVFGQYEQIAQPSKAEARAWYEARKEELLNSEKMPSLRNTREEIESLTRTIRRLRNEIKILMLMNNNLKSIPHGIILELHFLDHLSLQGNQLGAMFRNESGSHKQIFNGLSYLKYLDLSRNNITTVPKGSFNELPDLSVLVLDYNSLTTLSSGIFQGLNSLTSLFISNNQLTELPLGVFSDVPTLENMWLSSNKLTNLPEGLLLGLTHLTRLDVSQNKLTELKASFLKDVPSLHTLCVSDNELTDLQEDTFQGVSLLRTLDLSRNNLKQLKNSVLSPLKCLEHLDVQGNHLTTLFTYRTETWPILSDAIFSGNKITALNEKNLRAWLAAVAGARSRLLDLEGNALQAEGSAEALSWALEDPGVEASASDGQQRSACGSLQRGAATVLLCVNARCDPFERCSRDWREVVRSEWTTE